MMRKFFLTANAESLDYLIVPVLFLLITLVVGLVTVWVFHRKPARKKRRKHRHSHSRKTPAGQRDSATPVTARSSHPDDS